MNLNVGIDVSKAKLDLCGMDGDQNIVFQDSVANRPDGVKAIKQYILDAYKKCAYERVIVGLEATSVYNVLPSYELTNDSDLEAIGLEVVTLNPKMTHRFSQVYDQDKTDSVDARNIADFLRVGRYEVPVPRDERHLALQRLTRERFHLTKEITWCKNHFLNNLYYKMNTIDAELPTSVFGATIMTVLTDERYSLDELADLPLEQLTADLNALGHGRFGDPEAVAKALKRSARDSYRLNKQVMDSVNLVLGMYANEIRMFSKQMKELNKSIAALCEATPEAKCLESIPGIGPVYAAGIIAEIGQPERFKNEASLAKYAGLVWRRSQSGNTERQATPRVHSGDQYLRYYLVEAANSVRTHDPVFGKYYDKKYREVPKYQHRRASLLTARKLVRLVLTLMKNHQLYDPAKLV
jgi:transposase